MTKEELFNQGMELYAEEKMEEALAAYKKALELDPNYEDALHALAMAYANLERLDEAIEVGKKLVQVCPDDELAHTSLSIFYQRKGMIAEAEHEQAEVGNEPVVPGVLRDHEKGDRQHEEVAEPKYLDVPEITVGHPLPRRVFLSFAVHH